MNDLSPASARSMSPVITLHGTPDTARFTPVVLGTPRGGTSMLAGLCRIFGFDMGADVDPANNEDRDFLIHSGDRILLTGDKRARKRKAVIAELDAAIAARNARGTAWGWKDPMASFYIEDVFHSLVNPVFLCVLRDPAAVAAREIRSRRIGDDDDRRKILQVQNATDQHHSILSVIDKTRVPTLIVSYERALRHPEPVVEALAHFLGVDLGGDPALFERAVRFIVPERVTADIALTPGDRGAAEQHAGGGAADPFTRQCKDAVARLGPLGALDPQTLKQTVRDAQALLVARDPAGAVDIALRALYGIGSAYPELRAHPAGLDRREAWSGAADWPLVVPKLWFLVGLANLQGGDPDLAFHAFRAVVRYFDRFPASYDRRGAAVPYWGALYHLGFAGEVVGRHDEARAAYLRLLKGVEAGFQPETAAAETEPEEYQSYLVRASERMAGLTA